MVFRLALAAVAASSAPTMFACTAIIFAGAALADEGAVTTDELKTMCKAYDYAQRMEAVPRTAEDIVILKSAAGCTFYVAGIANLVMLPTVAPLLRFCIPKGMTMDQLRMSIVGLIRDAPKEMLEYSATLTIIAGLRINFPCARR
jgi:hypothetical protein